MQVLGQNPNGAHDRLAHIKVSGSLNDPADYEVEFPAEHLVQRLVLAGLGNGVPRQDQLSVGALKHWGEQSQKKFTVTPSSHAPLLNIRLQRLVRWNSSSLFFFYSCPNWAQIFTPGFLLWTWGVDAEIKTGLFICDLTAGRFYLKQLNFADTSWKLNVLIYVCRPYSVSIRHFF